MKQTIIIVCVVLTFLKINTTYGWDTTAAKYFPLHVGNVYKYHVNILGAPGYDYNRRIIKDTVINFKRYFVLSGFLPGTNGLNLRYDSTSGNIYNWSIGGYCSYSPFEMLIDSIRANKNDSTVVCYPTYMRYCTDTNSTTLFGIPVKTKTYKMFYSEGYASVIYGSNFGVVGATYHDFWSTSYHYIVGCYINGVLYGDTSMTGIQQISSEVPDEHKLFQNYPNPFNPATNIRFDIPSSSHVKLTIYDALGRVVTTLVNEKLSAGSYKTEWDASGFPSGVYYYRFETNNYNETKRMVLIK